MRGQSETQLIEFNGWTLRVRISEAHPPRPLLLIHGWTGDENSMWVFARRLPQDYWIIAPRAPHATKPSGFSWRVGSPAPGGWPDLDSLAPAAANLLSLLDLFTAERGLEARTWNLMGFSQGAAVASAMALMYPERVEKVALLAGFVPRGAERLATRVPLRGKQVFIAHGSLDERVDPELGRQAARLLESAGASVQLCEDKVGHKVSADCMRRMLSFYA